MNSPEQAGAPDSRARRHRDAADGHAGVSDQGRCGYARTGNLPFDTVRTLFELSKLVTRDKIKDIKIEFWSDESHGDALSSFKFHGWISSCNVASGVNHTLTILLQPSLDAKQFVDMQHGN